jgi:hypothetical protein
MLATAILASPNRVAADASMVYTLFTSLKMSVYNFITQLVASLAWPVTVLICVVLLKPLFATLVPLIRTLKYSDVEIQFGREVAELKIAAASLQPVNIEATQQPIWEDLVRLASVRPRTAILKAWQQVEATLVRVAKNRHLEVAAAVWQMPMVLGALMFNKGEISPPQYEMLSRLRHLVSDAQHAPVDSVNPDDAVEFVGLALRMAASVDSGS